MCLSIYNEFRTHIWYILMLSLALIRAVHGGQSDTLHAESELAHLLLIVERCQQTRRTQSHGNRSLSAGLDSPHETRDEEDHTVSQGQFRAVVLVLLDQVACKFDISMCFFLYLHHVGAMYLRKRRRDPGRHRRSGTERNASACSRRCHPPALLGCQLFSPCLVNRCS